MLNMNATHAPRPSWNSPNRIIKMHTTKRKRWCCSSPWRIAELNEHFLWARKWIPNFILIWIAAQSMSFHFIDKETDTLRVYVICQWSPSWWMADPWSPRIMVENHYWGMFTVLLRIWDLCHLQEQKPGERDYPWSHGFLNWFKIRNCHQKQKDISASILNQEGSRIIMKSLRIEGTLW